MCSNCRTSVFAYPNTHQLSFSDAIVFTNSSTFESAFKFAVVDSHKSAYWCTIQFTYGRAIMCPYKPP